MRKLFLSTLLLPFFAISTFAQEFEIKDLGGGMWSNVSSNRIPDNSAALIQNFYTDVETIAIERNGYEKRDSTVLGDTDAVTGLWEFVDSTSAEFIISFSSRTFYKNEVGGTPTAFGLVATVDTVPEATVNLGRIWFVNGTDDLWWFDGTSTGNVSGSPLGTIIVSWRERIAIGGIAAARSTVRFSEDGDGTNWTLGGNLTDPFAISIGGGDDGFSVTCMWSTYIDSLIISRKRDLWALSGFDQGDVELRQVSSEIGCIQKRSMREFDGSLLFMSNRGMEEMRGITIKSITEPIRNLTDSIVGNTANLRTNNQTSQSDFEAGTHTVSGYLTTTLTFDSIELSTATAVDSFIDNEQSDFRNGVGVVTGTSIPVAGVVLTKSFEGVQDSYTDTTNSGVTPTCQFGDYNVYAGRSLDISGSDYVLFGVTLEINKGSTPSDREVVVGLWSDSGNAPDVLIASHTTTAASFSGGNEQIRFNFDNGARIVNGSRYWITLQTQCNDGATGGNTVTLRGDNASGDGSAQVILSNQTVTVTDPSSVFYYYKAHGGGYALSGYFTSQIFDVGFSTDDYLHNWGTFDSIEVLDTGTVSYETQSSTSSTGTFSTLQVSTDGVTIPSPRHRFIRYKASLTSPDDEHSPLVQVVALNNGIRLRPTAVFTSQVFETGDDITSWGPTSIQDTVEAGTIQYDFASSTSSDEATFTNWASIVSGGVPSVSTNAFATFIGTFTANAATSTIRLNGFQTSWNEGTDTQPVSSWEHDRRYWLSFTTSTASGAINDTVLIYQRDRTWSLFGGISASSFATWLDDLYFGNSNSTGLVYKFDVGNNDDGNDITSTIVFKSYDLGSHNQDKDFRTVYANFLGGESGSFSLGYDVDRSGNEYSLGSALMTEGEGQVSAKFPFPLSNPVQGRELQYTLTKSGTGDRLKLYDLKTMFSVLEAR